MEEKVREILQKYQQMKIGQNVIVCPYFMNMAKRSVIHMLREVPISEAEIDSFSTMWKEGKTDYGRFQGKGNPEEIIKPAIEITDKMGLPIEKVKKPEVALEIMKHVGLGIDCSGLVFNLFLYAFNNEDVKKEFLESLDWQETDKMDASRAGAFVFAGKASDIVKPDQLKPMDLVLIRNSSGKYIHIAIVLSGRQNGFEVVQSSLLTTPTGINISSFKIVDGSPEFEYKPSLGKNWEELYRIGKLEFRRLNILK